MAGVRKTGLRASSGHHTLSFGLVRVGVDMGPLFEAEKRVAGRMICDEHKESIKQLRVCPHDGCDAEVVKAYPHGDGFVTLDAGEVPKPEGDGLIALKSNVPEADVHPEYVENTYLLWPTDGSQDDGYNLVLNYLRSNERAFIGTTVDHGTTKAFAVRYSAVTKSLVAQVLNYAANVRWANAGIIENYLGELDAPSKDMADMAASVFENLPETFEWDSIEDEYGLALTAAIAEKAATGAVAATCATVASPAEGSLMEALRASVEANPKSKKGKVRA